MLDKHHLEKSPKVRRPDESDDRAISSDDPSYAITLNFELLEDSYVIFDGDGGRSADISSLLSFGDEEVGHVFSDAVIFFDFL